MKTAAIINPISGQGRAVTRWDRLQGGLRDLYGPMKVCVTERRGHAVALTRSLLDQGVTHVIAGGGDGTHLEIVNGCFRDGAPINPDVRLTIIPLGTGSDLARGLGIRAGRGLLTSLAGASTLLADVVRITYAAEHGASDRTTSYFLNMGRIGMGATVCRYVNEHSKSMGGFISYLVGLLATLRTYEDRDITFTIDGQTTVSGLTKDFSLANGTYDAGGMRMAPHARFDSGVLDMYHISPLGYWDAVRSLPKLYQGRLAERSDIVRYFRGRHIEAVSEAPVEIEIEGDFVGYLPATIDLLPGIMRLTAARNTAV